MSRILETLAFIRDYVYRSLEMLSGKNHITPEVKLNWNRIQF